MDRLPVEIVGTIAKHAIFQKNEAIGQYRLPLIQTHLLRVNRQFKDVCLSVIAAEMFLVRLRLDECEHTNAEKDLAPHHYQNLRSQAVDIPVRESCINKPSAASIHLTCGCARASKAVLELTLVCDELNALAMLGTLQIRANSLPKQCRNLYLQIHNYHSATSDSVQAFFRNIAGLMRNFEAIEISDIPVDLRSVLGDCELNVAERDVTDSMQFLPVLEHHLGRISHLIKNGVRSYQLLTALTTFLEVIEQTTRDLRSSLEHNKADANYMYYLVQSYSMLLFRGLSEYSLRNERSEDKQQHWLVSDDKFNIVRQHLLPWELNLFGMGSTFSEVKDWIADGKNPDFFAAMLMSLIQFRTALARAGTIEAHSLKIAETYPKYMIMETLDEFDKLRESYVAEQEHVRTWISQIRPFMFKLRGVYEETADVTVLDEPMLKGDVDIGCNVGEDIDGRYHLRFGDWVLDRTSTAETL